MEHRIPRSISCTASSIFRSAGISGGDSVTRTKYVRGEQVLLRSDGHPPVPGPGLHNTGEGDLSPGVSLRLLSVLQILL